MSGWWRAYDEAVDDPKLQLLSPAQFKAWFNLMCLVSGNRNGTLPPIEKIAFKLRVSTLKARLIVSDLMAVGLFDQRADKEIEPHNWLGRQYISDRDPTAAQRSKRYRNKLVTRVVTDASRVSHAVQTTDTDTDKNIYPSKDDWPEDYRDRFWQAYPRKVGKGAVIRKLEAIRQRREIGFAALLSAVSKIKASEEKFIPHPLTWLNQGRYLDNAANGGELVPKPSEEETARLMAKYEERRAREGWH